VYQVKNTKGELIALHERIDAFNGKKRVFWKKPDGSYGLDRPLVDLPFFGSEHVSKFVHFPVIVCEGEKATSALLDLGIPALGTVTGAAIQPRDVSILTQFPVVILFPDNDDIGKQHMYKIGRVLEDTYRYMNTKVFLWKHAPEHGDAYDLVHAVAMDKLKFVYPSILSLAIPFSDWFVALPVKPQVFYLDDGHAPIVDVVRRFMVIKKVGSGCWQGLCPFHDEDTPSFTIYEDTNRYFCFGCLAQGNTVQFVMHVHNISYKDAVEWLHRL